MKRSLNFKNKAGNRYWWFKHQDVTYIPPIFSFLTDAEWDVLEEWYDETDARGSAGESNIPAMSYLQGLIMGSRINNIVQLGHYEGFSTLLIGFMMKHMGFKNAFISIDIDVAVTEYTQKWLDKAGLQEYAKLVVSDSSSPSVINLVNNYFGSQASLVFIDSSHAYDHTIKELDLWYPNIKTNGVIAMHDVSEFAVEFDYTHRGGVKKAVLDWSRKYNAKSFLLNGELTRLSGENISNMIYQDACGLGLIQKV